MWRGRDHPATKKDVARDSLHLAAHGSATANQDIYGRRYCPRAQQVLR